MADTLPFVVRPMAVADLPQVMAIERLSFSAPWSERAYRYEIEKNPNGAMLVARPAAGRLEDRKIGRSEDAPPASSQSSSLPSSQSSAVSRLLRRLKPSPPAPVVGYGGLWLLVDEAHISTIAVHPDWRGRGLGELLVLALIQRGIDLGARIATLEVRVSNHVAQGLYEKYWFDVVGRQRRYYSDNNEDALIMTTPAFTTPEFQDLLRRNREQLYERLKRESLS